MQARVEPEVPRTNLWRRAQALVLAQLRQGATPHRLALSVAIASALALFPVLGTTTVLCLALGAALKLNHPLMQFVNYLLSGLQLLVLVPLLKAGEWLGAPHLSLSLPELQARFSEAPWASLREFGVIALGGIGAWAVAAPLWALLVYALLRPLLERGANRRATDG